MTDTILLLREQKRKNQSGLMLLEIVSFPVGDWECLMGGSASRLAAAAQ